MAYRRALQRQAKREALPAGSLRQHSEGDSAGTSFGFDNDAVLKFCSLSLQYTGCATPDDLKLTPTGTQRTGRHHQPIVTSRVMQLIDPAEMTEKQLLQVSAALQYSSSADRSQTPFPRLCSSNWLGSNPAFSVSVLCYAVV